MQMTVSGIEDEKNQSLFFKKFSYQSVKNLNINLILYSFIFSLIHLLIHLYRNSANICWHLPCVDIFLGAEDAVLQKNKILPSKN